MKNLKIICCVFFISFTSAFSQNYKLEVSYGLANNASLGGSALSSGAYQLNLGYLTQTYDTFSIGAGASYIWPSQYADTSTKVNPVDSIIPIYGLFKYELMPEATVEPYLIGRAGFGFSLPNEKVSGARINNGLYYSLGVGAGVNDFFVEFTYDTNQGTYSTSSSGSGDLNYKRFTFSIGYKLKFINADEETYYNKQIEYINPKRKTVYDNVEIYDENGNVIEREGEFKELEDSKIIH